MIKEKIEQEIKIWREYIEGIDAVAEKRKKDNILTKKELKSLEKDVSNIKMEAGIAVRTLTWVLETMDDIRCKEELESNNKLELAPIEKEIN